MTDLIEAHGLTKRYRRLDSWRAIALLPFRPADHLAVDGVSFDVERGEVFGLLGQNGAGKTTLIRMLTTLLLPTSGRATIDGLDVVADARDVRRRIGLAGDERSFSWRLTGRQNLEFFAALQLVGPAVARARIERLVERLDLGRHIDRPVASYSTGLRQRLAIARALVHEPEVLFLDEPTRSLDPISTRAIRDLIAEYVVTELGRTVVLATHSMPEAEALCRRMALVRSGRFVAEGSVVELRRTIGAGVTCDLRLRSVASDLPERLARVAGVRSVERVTGRDRLVGGPDDVDLRLRLDPESAVLAAVLRVVSDSGAEVHRCTTHEASLEDVFVALLGPTAAASTTERAMAAPAQ